MIRLASSTSIWVLFYEKDNGVGFYWPICIVAVAWGIED
jgi:hypothetical protein